MKGLWQLPGPQRFLETTMLDVDNGVSIVLQVPPHAPSGLRSEVCRLSRDTELWRWDEVHEEELAANDAFELCAQLARRLVPAEADVVEAKIDRLANRLHERLIWIELTRDAKWPVWRDFLERYRLANHSIPEPQRGVFCVFVPATWEMPGSDVGLTVRRFHGVVSPFDARLLLETNLSPPRDGTSAGWLRRELKASIATQLAGADLVLALELADWDLDDLIWPTRRLREYANDCEWMDAGREADWRHGTADVVNGRETAHSAHIAANGDDAPLTRRVWRGQLSVLFPHVEDERLKLLRQVRGLLEMPVQTPQGAVSDPSDLEIGQLVHFLRGRRVPNGIWQQLVRLRDIRHTLAHLRPVPPSLLPG